MADKIKPFIESSDRRDILADLARDHSERINKSIAKLIDRNHQIDPKSKKDGKDGTKDVGESGAWLKGQDTLGGKDDKDGKDEKDGGKDGEKDGTKDSTKDGNKEGKDGFEKPSKEAENSVGQLRQEVALPAYAFNKISEMHSLRLAKLLDKPIF